MRVNRAFEAKYGEKCSEIKKKEGGKRALKKKRPQNCLKKKKQAGFEGAFSACLSIWPTYQ